MSDTTIPIVTGFDTETHRFGMGLMAPPPVCLTASTNKGEDQFIAARGNDDLHDALRMMIESPPTSIIVAHNAPYDLAVIANEVPDLWPAIFDGLIEGRIHDTRVREKMLNLAQFGNLDMIPLGPEGAYVKVMYQLPNLVEIYFGLDISEGKSGEDAWRLNFQVLEDIPHEEWPEEARKYAIDDSVWAEMIWYEQEARRQMLIEATGIDPFEQLDFRCAANMALHLMGSWGLCVDAERRQEIVAMLEEELKPENLSHLLASGILSPAEEPRPYANGAKDHVEGCDKKDCDCPAKLTADKPEKIAMKQLKEHVEQLCKDKPDLFTLKTTDKGNTSLDAEWLEDHAAHDPILSEYQHRQKWQKIITTELPRMCHADGTVAEIVHPRYDILKETGRTSSYGEEAVPSLNIQNVDPRVRPCFVPRPGYNLFSIDYSQMELGTAAQKCLSLFGHSILADKINAGTDVHAYLGAQLCAFFDPNYQEAMQQLRIDPDDRERVHAEFEKMKGHEVEEIAKKFKHYRTFAKPTNLGYPGGLGAKTFVAYAKSPYGVIVSMEEAEQMKEVWLATFPEFVEYFEWINHECIDDTFSEPGDIRYCYRTPLGLYRPNCTFCAAANGAALQSPSAEGALLATFSVVRACYDHSQGSILCADSHGPRVRPIGFIHDELLGEVRADDPDLRHECITEMQRIMVECMQVITPDVQARTEACLMERWYKEAEAVYDDQGRLDIWRPAD